MSPASKPERPESAGPGLVHLDADLARVGPAVDELRAWVRANATVDDAWLDEVSLATIEALTNAIRHGGGGAKDFKVRFAWRRRGDDLEIEVAEPGAFTPGAHWHELPTDPLSEGGRGGHLITRLMDSTEHRNADGFHALGMRRRIVGSRGTPLRPSDDQGSKP